MAAPVLLVFDTSGPQIAAAVVRGDVVCRQVLEPMERGQAERLMPLLESLLVDEGLGWQDLTALGVGIGPGNFTGIRIAVAAARGLALGLAIPALGISGFELARDPDSSAPEPAELVSLPAPRDQAHVQAFRHGRPDGRPRLIDPAAPPADLAAQLVTGHRAAEMARALVARHRPAAMASLPEALARVAARKWASGSERDQRPAPLYVRPADAAPPAEAPPALIG